MSACKVLKDARDLIAEPKHWTQRELAKDRKGLPTSVQGSNVVCMCSVGALMRAAGGTINPDYDDARSVLQHVIAPRNLIEFNDSPNTKHEDVIGAFDKAIASCES